MQRSIAASLLLGRQLLWPSQLLAQNGLGALQLSQPQQQFCTGAQPQRPQCQQQHPHFLLPQQLQQARSMSFAVKVDRNNVDKAMKILNKHFRDEGMVKELRSREYRKTTSQLRFEANRATYNKRVGQLISQRLKWVIRRRKLKM